MTDLASLIARLEAAEGAAFALDVAIARAVYPNAEFNDCGYRVERFNNGHGIAYLPPQPYTRSIDSALSLVPEGWFLHMARFTLGNEPRCEVYVYNDVRDQFEGKASTLPHALCLAALKARAQG